MTSKPAYYTKTRGGEITAGPCARVVPPVVREPPNPGKDGKIETAYETAENARTEGDFPDFSIEGDHLLFDT